MASIEIVYVVVSGSSERPDLRTKEVFRNHRDALRQAEYVRTGVSLGRGKGYMLEKWEGDELRGYTHPEQANILVGAATLKDDVRVLPLRLMEKGD